jgi:hypothetical protein
VDAVSTYDSLDAYTADVIAAREAYAADQRVAAGYCETGDGRKRHAQCRKCWACRRKEQFAREGRTS